MINNSSIKLEKDSIQSNNFYITFKYIALADFNLNVYINAKFIKSNDEKNSIEIDKKK